MTNRRCPQESVNTHWAGIFRQKSRTSFWNRRHTFELLLLWFIKRATWIGIVHSGSRSRRDSLFITLSSSANLQDDLILQKEAGTVVCTLKQHTHQGMSCSSSCWKAKPTSWTLLRGISHLWQRLPAGCSTIFICSPAKQTLCRYQNTKVACFRFPCSFSVL